MKDKVKTFLMRFKIFLWYLATEPFREIYGFLYNISEALNKTKSWLYVFLVISITAMLMGKRPIAGLFMTVLLVMILLWEWQSGYFMQRYRRTQKKKIKKVLREKEGKLIKQNGGDNNG